MIRISGILQHKQATPAEAALEYERMVRGLCANRNEDSVAASSLCQVKEGRQQNLSITDTRQPCVRRDARSAAVQQSVLKRASQCWRPALRGLVAAPRVAARHGRRREQKKAPRASRLGRKGRSARARARHEPRVHARRARLSLRSRRQEAPAAATTMRQALFAVLLLPTAVSALPLLRLRGGGLSREEIIDKLNKVPTFAIVNDEDQVIPLADQDGSRDVCWFTDAAEAQQLLELTKAANPENADVLRLAVTPMGQAFLRCGGFDAEEDVEEGQQFLGGTLKLRGPRAIVEANTEALRSQQVAQGIKPGAWVVPIYCHDDFQTEQMMPMFMSPADFASGWKRTGRPQDAVPENLAVMELRVLVKQMEQTDVFNWRIFQFVSSEEAYALAQQLIGERRAAEGDDAEGAATADGVDGSGGDDDDDDDVAY